MTDLTQVRIYPVTIRKNSPEEEIRVARIARAVNWALIMKGTK